MLVIVQLREVWLVPIVGRGQRQGRRNIESQEAAEGAVKLSFLARRLIVVSSEEKRARRKRTKRVVTQIGLKSQRRYRHPAPGGRN